MIKYDARLNHRPHVHRINLYDPVQMLRAVEHKRIIDRLTALAGTTARGSRDTPFSRAISRRQSDRPDF